MIWWISHNYFFFQISPFPPPSYFIGVLFDRHYLLNLFFSAPNGTDQCYIFKPLQHRLYDFLDHAGRSLEIVDIFYIFDYIHQKKKKKIAGCNKRTTLWTITLLAKMPTNSTHSDSSVPFLNICIAASWPFSQNPLSFHNFPFHIKI